MDKDSSGSRNPGGFGLFGSAGPQYSKTELAGVPLTGMSPISPYLNVDPRYLIQDTDEFILPTGANKTRGRFELAFFTIGGCCITGAVCGAVNGLRMGLSETRNMAWSKPRNVQILNMVTRQGATWANTLGSVALLYSAFGVIIEKARGAEDDLNTIAAGTMTGVLYKSPALHIFHGCFLICVLLWSCVLVFSCSAIINCQSSVPILKTTRTEDA
ncbi:mitochondrial import inner membrane translocase subunit Tim23B isoform X1 [Danio aesculapii]|uniref:mitochondrial import inner membrane translocase subunit Tim23B isoform X1 n=1 Tax=Danio aesculapii TaxID=1142201 RepID=UPI0024C097A1|nr:mitochondrial import inner membrane translocase subunit Tim23B isoform X1 [Danio aesculapii]